MNILEQIYNLTEQKKFLEKEIERLYRLAEEKNISKQGNFVLERIEQVRREVIVDRFVTKYGKEVALSIATIPVGKAEEKVGKLPDELTLKKTVVSSKVVKVAAAAKTA